MPLCDGTAFFLVCISMPRPWPIGSTGRTEFSRTKSDVVVRRDESPKDVGQKKKSFWTGGKRADELAEITRRNSTPTLQEAKYDTNKKKSLIQLNIHSIRNFGMDDFRI